MLLSLNHVSVLSFDFERTERFYCDLLGMRVGPRPNFSVPGRWLYVGDQPLLHMLPRTNSSLVTGEVVLDHFALTAQDMPAFEQRFTAAGLPFRRIQQADTGIWQLFLDDPDGVHVELNFGLRAIK